MNLPNKCKAERKKERLKENNVTQTNICAVDSTAWANKYIARKNLAKSVRKPCSCNIDMFLVVLKLQHFLLSLPVGDDVDMSYLCRYKQLLSLLFFPVGGKVG